MKQVVNRGGAVRVEEIPAPQVEAGYVLVEVAYSLISTGTEVSIVAETRKSLLTQAVEQPQKIRKAVDHLKSQGLQKTVEKIRQKVDAAAPLGYSCSGRVLQVGQGVAEIAVGDRVACAGAGQANHAEYVLVPQNLVVKVPKSCSLRDAASVTLGAIAMQGVRRCDPRLGEYVAVVGLGLLGLITTQLLKAAGCRVIGIDIDPRRTELARQFGADLVLLGNQVDVPKEVLAFTESQGSDAVIITAASSSDSIVQQAMEMTRKKGRVVVVGAVGLGLQRSPFYEKEIDFLISTSYGPGRYDQNYEHRGLDYPYAYVRWTENRNMQEYLRLIAGGSLQVGPLFEQEYPVHEAVKAYEALLGAQERPLGVLLSYPEFQEGKASRVYSPVVALHQSTKSKDKIGAALVGAGSFARAVHLPNLRRLAEKYELRTVVDANGMSAKTAAEQYGAARAATSFEEVLNDEAVDLVMICTRHHLHARLALQALRAGKHVFVEKPLALTQAELCEIEQFYVQEQASPLPLLLTGFNRRFSPYLKKMRAAADQRQDPLVLNYRLNAGYIPLDSWVHGEEGGGRNLGEACHIYDLFTCLTGSEAVRVETQTLKPGRAFYSPRDNFVTTISFSDGSVASLTYTALGSPAFPKEQFEMYCGGKVFALDDYQKLTLNGARSPLLESKTADKGHFAELVELAGAVLDGNPWPIPLWQQVQATRIALQVEEQIQPQAAARASNDLDN